MGSKDKGYDNLMECASNRTLFPPSFLDVSGIEHISPRVGHEYQVEVPSMINESERSQLQMNPTDSEFVHDKSHSFALGLPIPLLMVHDDVEDSRHRGLGEKDGAVNVNVSAVAANVEKNGILDNGKDLRPTTIEPEMTVDQLSKSKSSLMAPGTLSNSWNGADVKSFLLGLYVFGKDFDQIRRFLDNKEMGEILSFYYGRFHKSDEYCRWSDRRKRKGRKCVHKLFAGQKQHELYSRLIPHVSEELRDTLIEIFKSYEEGKTSLQVYISSLKSTVGLGVLVEAVGIGKGKEDLTSLAMERGKKKREFQTPTNTAWSSLGPSDIIKKLTGGIQLSKAKSNDLFWEAVWPRLLARGWHSESEQPKNQGSKDFLVFLIPGVKKFSRRKLVKGDHYFDSVSDVLRKVAADPNLLELEVEEAKVASYNDEVEESGSNEDSQSDHRCHSYLKPRASTKHADNMKHAVIDTSLAHEGKSMIRKLKSVPGNSVGKIDVDAPVITYKRDKHTSKANHSKGKLDSNNQKSTMFEVVDTSLLYEGNLCKVHEMEHASKMSGVARKIDMFDHGSLNETEASLLIYTKKKVRNADCQKVTKNRDSTSLKKANCNPDNIAKKKAEKHENQKTSGSDCNQVKGTIKHQFSRRPRSDHSNPAVPPIKRRKLAACVKAETSRILEKNSSGGLGSETFSQSSCFPDANNNASGVPVSHQKDVSLVSSSAEGNLEENDEGSIHNRVCLNKCISTDKVEKCESGSPINFNALQVPLQSEEGEMMAMEEEDKPSPKPNNSMTRRQSTRHRPLTVRALESFANDFLQVQRRRRRKDTQKNEDKTMLHGDCSVNENTSKPLDCTIE
ncbi:uncharacterized protein LOC130721029 isoform X2 [Lotus japonicus]|nr:uncharacterized protein LOC130721029 isoform X2 [Lotus japonicus]